MPNLIVDSEKVIILLKRISFQILEDNLDFNEIYLFSISTKSFNLVSIIEDFLNEFSDKKIITIDLEKATDINIPTNSSVVLIDDVVNSGITMINQFVILQKFNAYKIRTVSLIERSYRLFPIKLDFVGLSLSTTMKNNVEVRFLDDKIEVYLY